MKNFNLHAFADEAGQDLNEQIAALRDNGYEGMEIRNVEGQNVSALTLERAKEIDKRMKDAGLCVWSIGSPIGKISLEDDFEKHMDLYKHTLEVSAVFEARAFRLFSFYMPKDETDFSKYKNEVIERMGRFAEEAKQYDIKICHENEKAFTEILPQDALKFIKQFRNLEAFLTRQTLSSVNRTPWKHGIC